MSDRPALPLLDHVTNFRELGGLTTTDGRRVKRHHLFRSSHWGRASAEDVAVLDRFGIGVVIDFRSQNDIALEGPDRLPAGTRQLSFATLDPASGTDIRSLIKDGDLETIRSAFGGDGAHRYMLEGAVHLVTQRTQTFGRFLACLCEPDLPPALFHCSAGKDRAGWAASTLLLALGVDEATVADHYLLSNEHFQPEKQHGWSPPTNEEISEMLAPLVGVKLDYVEASIAAAKREWGSLDGYLSGGLGISDAQREQLRNNWLE